MRKARTLNSIVDSLHPTTKFVFRQLMYLLSLLILVVTLAYSLTNFARLAKASLENPFSLEYAEGPILNQTVGLARGENIYHNDFSVPPYTVSNYPPLYLLVQVPFVWIFGPSYWYGRLISITCALMTALFIGLVLHKLTSDRIASLISGLIFLAFPYVQIFSNYNRIDLLALALSWAAILVLVYKVDHHWGVPLAAMFFVASVYTRQDYGLAGPGACFAWLLMTHRPRQAIRLAVWTGGTGLAIFLLLNWLTRGGFYLNIVAANIHPYYWAAVLSRITRFYENTRFLLIIVVLFSMLGWRKESFHTWTLAFPYLVGAGLSALTLGKVGSDLNHLLELVAALSFAIGASLVWIGKFGWARIVVLVVITAQVYIMTKVTTRSFNQYFLFSSEEKAQFAELARLVTETDGIVLADHYMGLIPLAEKRIYFQPFDYKMLSDSGRWDQQLFLDAIREGDFALILISPPPDLIAERWTPEMLEAINASYRRDRILFDTWIFTPR